MSGKPFFFVPIFDAICLVSLPLPWPPARAQAAPSGQEDTPAMVLHVESREAVIDVVARDRRNLPITDLAANEFEVYEVPNHGGKIPRRILYLRTIDPERKNQEEDATSGFHVSSGAVCALDATVHYQIAIQASSEPGFHAVLVKSTRPHVNLSFRRQYYVGHTRENVALKDLKALVTPEALQEAACYHPLTPPTLAMTAKVLAAPGGTTTRYAVAIKPESLSAIGINGAVPRVQLDFGMCVFDAAGEVAHYLHSTVDHQMNATDIARLPDHGFVSFLEAPGPEPPALARLAVLDRNTGNLGVVDVSRPLPIAAQTSQAGKKKKLLGDIRAFGAATPSDNAFCGDVYELPVGATSVDEFSEVDPVASLYTNTLNVPNQDITRMGGIPGITHSSLWFGIDYYGKFYVTNPGAYSFELQSDDGSRLEIDNHLLVDLDGVHAVDQQTAKTTLSAGWHSIHVPYFQGPPTALALVLRIQPPGESLRPFNLNEFVPPATGVGMSLPLAVGASAQSLTADQKSIIETARAKYYSLESRGFASASCTANFDFKTIPSLPSADPAADRKLIEETVFSLNIGGTDRSPVKVKVQYPKEAADKERERAAPLTSLVRSLVQGTFDTWGTKGLHGPVPAFDSEIESVTASSSGYTILFANPDDPVRIELDKSYLVTEIVSNGGKIDEKPVYASTADGWVYTGNLAMDDSNPNSRVMVQYELGSQVVDGLRLPATVHLRVNKNIDVKFSLNNCIVRKGVVLRVAPQQEEP
jgi:hypothetical protein